MAEVFRRFDMPLGLMAFWAGLVAAARAYSAGYDWPYQTISVLLYSDQNPHGYYWAWAGLEFCGLAGIVWSARERRRLEVAIPAPTAAGFRLLQLGFLCMCGAVLPDRLLPWSKGHELLAIFAFLGICIGVTCRMAGAIAGMAPYRRGSPQTGVRTWIRWFPALAPLVPIVLAGATQIYLSVERPTLPWVSPNWRIRGISPFLSFGFWEWISCAVLTMSLLLIWSCGLQEHRSIAHRPK